MKEKKKFNIISNILLVCCVVVFLFSLWKVAGYLIEYRKGEESYESIMDEAVVIPEAPDVEVPEEDLLPVIDWDALYAMNDDLLGFLYIPDTIIQYPIVQGSDNEYYLTHTFSGETNKCGCIFMDTGNQADFTSDNTLLHGHNMKTGKMFGSLRKYEDKSYWEEHPYIWILTEDTAMKYHIFSSGRTDAGSYVYTLKFGSEQSFETYIQKRTKIDPYYDTGVEVTTQDRLLTLSTCTSDTEEGRRVVQAKLVEIKEINNEQ